MVLSKHNLSEHSTSETKLLAVLLLAVCVAVLVAHWPALSAKALSFDDSEYVTDNVLVRNPSWKSTQRFLTEILNPSTIGGYYQPLAMISLMTDYALGGRPDNLRPFHRTSLALHAANTALIIVLLYMLFGRVWIAAAAGLLFGVHPLTVEPIPWVGERKTLLAAFFALWCLILYIHYARKSDWKLYVGCFLMYVLALLSKPTSTPLPVLMLLMDFWPLNRLGWKRIVEKLPFFVVGGISALITYISQSNTGGVELPAKYGPLRIPLVLCHNIVFYLYKMVWPINLSSHYAYPKPLALTHPMVLAGVIGTCILIPLLVISLRWTRGIVTGWLFFFMAILPTMQIIGFSNVIASDKFAYLPSVGLLTVLAAFLGWFCDTGKPVVRRTVVIIIVIILAGAESVATRRYLVQWHDSVSLFKHMLTLTPDAWSVHNMMGIALHSEDKTDEAIIHLRQAVKLEPNAADAHNSLGAALESQGKLDEAIGQYLITLQLNPRYVTAYYNLGNTLALQNKFDEAINRYRQALQMKPNYAKARINLGNALGMQGKLDEAMNHYRQALQIKPDDAELHSNMGITLARQGKPDEAIRHYRQAVKIDPDYLSALDNLAWILATHPNPTMRDGPGAVALAERAAELTKHQDANILKTLAAAYAAAGQRERAITTLQTAIKLAAGDDELANQIRSQLESYKQVKP